MKSCGVAGMIVILSGTVMAQARPQPAAGGRAVQARDGDVVMIEGDATVRLVRRREANITTVYNQAGRWVVIMADYVTAGEPPDGGVDWSYRFDEVSSWPLGERWSGAAVLDEYTYVPAGASSPSSGARRC